MTMKISSRVDIYSLTQFSNGKAFATPFLEQTLTDIETAVFFAKVMGFDAQDLGKLMRLLFGDTNDVIEELTRGTHSTELQDYLVEIDAIIDPAQLPTATGPYTPSGQVDADTLVKLWEAAEVMIAQSIQEVADGLSKHMGSLPTHEARLMFSTLAQHNVQRNSIGDYKAVIRRREDERKRKVLVVLDDSGSMSSDTIRRIAEPVVALAYKANASLVQISTTARFWEAGRFNVDDVLAAAEYGWTCYEELVPIFEEDWDEVICIADYDSAGGAKSRLSKVKGRIGRVTDISLVNQSTYLSECLGQFADEVRPVLISGNNSRF